jgi:hypothetical protein
MFERSQNGKHARIECINATVYDDRYQSMAGQSAEVTYWAANGRLPTKSELEKELWGDETEIFTKKALTPG